MEGAGMTFTSRLFSPFNKWYGALVSEFERHGNTLGPFVNGRYTEYAEYCRSQSNITSTPSPVRVTGSERIPGIVSRQAATELSETMTEELASMTGPAAATDKLLRKIDRPISTLGQTVLDIFRHPVLNEQVEGFFGSYYRIQWLDCYRSFPTEDVSHSWLWHSDNVPANTLKVMLHLTDAGAEQGATQFMNFEDTRAYYRAGYRGHTSRRLADLSAFAVQHNLPFRPFSHDAKAGDVMLFVNNALHKAVPPKQGYRDVLTYLLLPNPIPWHAQLETDGVDCIQCNPGGYPPNPATSRALANRAA